MGKEIAKKAGLAAGESVLASLMPQLLQRLDSMESKLESRFVELDRRLTKIEQRLDEMEKRLGGIGGRFDQLRIEFKQEFFDRTEQTTALFTELGLRINTVQSKFEQLEKSIIRQTDKMEELIERVVKVETVQRLRRRKAG